MTDDLAPSMAERASKMRPCVAKLRELHDRLPEGLPLFLVDEDDGLVRGVASVRDYDAIRRGRCGDVAINAKRLKWLEGARDGIGVVSSESETTDAMRATLARDIRELRALEDIIRQAREHRKVCAMTLTLIETQRVTEASDSLNRIADALSQGSTAKWVLQVMSTQLLGFIELSNAPPEVAARGLPLLLRGKYRPSRIQHGPGREA